MCRTRPMPRTVPPSTRRVANPRSTIGPSGRGLAHGLGGLDATLGLAGEPAPALGGLPESRRALDRAAVVEGRLEEQGAVVAEGRSAGGAVRGAGAGNVSAAGGRGGAARA